MIRSKDWATRAPPCTVNTNRRLGYERVYLPLREVADTPFHIQGD